jgi:hypothetical protein
MLLLLLLFMFLLMLALLLCGVRRGLRLGRRPRLLRDRYAVVREHDVDLPGSLFDGDPADCVLAQICMWQRVVLVTFERGEQREGGRREVTAYVQHTRS